MISTSKCFNQEKTNVLLEKCVCRPLKNLLFFLSAKLAHQSAHFYDKKRNNVTKEQVSNPRGAARSRLLAVPRGVTTSPHSEGERNHYCSQTYNPTTKHENVPGLIEYTNEKKRD